MNELKEIYDRITFLRGKGIKMKEMAEQAQLTPSVLSAMYSTVFPAYFKNVEKGMDDNEALDNALMWVNNLSKKKLFGLLPQMKQALFAMEVVVKEKPDSMNPFLSELEHNARQSVNHITNFSGIYTSYSLSSNTNDLKIEPYFIAPAENGNYIEVGHTNAHGTTHWGFGLMNGMSHLYLVSMRVMPRNFPCSIFASNCRCSTVRLSYAAFTNALIIITTLSPAVYYWLNRPTMPNVPSFFNKKGT